MFKWRRRFALLSFAGLILASCGIEDYKYLAPIDAGNILMELNTRATINLPSIDTTEYYYFRNFTIYYRIYISDINVPGQVSSDDLQNINSGLYNDYWALNPYTTLDNNRSPSAMGSIFSGRKFFTLAVEGASLDSLLGTGGSAATLVLNFAQMSTPSLTLNGSPPAFSLYRYEDSTVNRPLPDRYFINSSEIQNPANISTVTLNNMDVQDKEGISGQKYTYTAMYILLTGLDDNLVPLYSAPTFIGVFRLPD
jgi:hypothetical protein